MKSGIYIIKNLLNGKVYVGSAVSIKRRWAKHKHQLNKNKHHSKHLQRSWNKYGKDNFFFEVLQVVANKQDLIFEEQRHIDSFKSYDRKFGYNISPTAGSSLGVKHTIEMKKKVSAANKGKKMSLEARKKMSLSKLGNKNPMYDYVYSEEQKKKMSERNSGNGNPFYGKKHSAEIRKKMSETPRKKYKPKTKQHIDKITQAGIATKRGKSKLNEELVIEIRRLREEEKMKIKDIAKKFDLNTGHVGKICRYQIWKL